MWFPISWKCFYHAAWRESLFIFLHVSSVLILKGDCVETKKAPHDREKERMRGGRKNGENYHPGGRPESMGKVAEALWGGEAQGGEIEDHGGGVAICMEIVVCVRTINEGFELLTGVGTAMIGGR